MGWKKITLTEDHLALIENIKFETFEFENDSPHGDYGWGICEYNLFGGTYVLQDIALILGQYDKFIPGTEDDPLGRQYPKELEDYWWDLYRYIWENMEYIISLVFYYVMRGGLTPGTYKCKDNEKIWTKIE